MENNINVLILAAGHAGFEERRGGYPIFLSEISGALLCEHMINTLAGLNGARFAFALREEDIDRFHLDRIVSLLVDDPVIVRVPNGTRGSACTALFAAATLDRNAELLIMSANELLNMDMATVISNFRERGLDGGTLVFKSIHPRYSYVKLDENGFVTEATQQTPISKHATAGVFWFKSTGEFIESVKNTIRKDQHTNGNFYIAPVFNELILKQKKVGVEPIPDGCYLPAKTEAQVQHLEEWVKYAAFQN